MLCHSRKVVTLVVIVCYQFYPLFRWSSTYQIDELQVLFTRHLYFTDFRPYGCKMKYFNMVRAHSQKFRDIIYKVQKRDSTKQGKNFVLIWYIFIWCPWFALLSIIWSRWETQWRDLCPVTTSTGKYIWEHRATRYWGRVGTGHFFWTYYYLGSTWLWLIFKNSFDWLVFLWIYHFDPWYLVLW